MKQQIDEAIEIASLTVEPSAKVIKKFYDALVKEGFSEKDAVELCKNYRIR